MIPCFELRPHIGFGPILLGSLQMEIRASMNAAGFVLETSHGQSDYFCDSSVQVEFTDGRATFIGISFSKAFQANYSGVNVFDLPAEKFFDLIAANESSGGHLFNEYEQYFPNQVMTLWDADSQYDRIGAESRMVWAQVGLGDESYAEFRRKRNDV